MPQVAAYLAAHAIIAFIVKLVAVAAVSYAVAKYQAKQMHEDARFQSRDYNVRAAKEPEIVVYGQAWIAGPIMYLNQRHDPASKDNYEVYIAVAHAAHECGSITNLMYDDDTLVDGVDIDWSGGNITAGKYGVSKAGIYAVSLERYLGTSTQTASPLLTAAFTDWTSAHRARGRAYTVHCFRFFSQTSTAPEQIFYSGPPSNIRALVNGKKCYNPALDSTVSGGSGSHRYATPSTWQWSENPVVCACDYMTQSWNIDPSRIDWAYMVGQIAICDALVLIPPASPATHEKRYACNGAISLGNTHGTNLDAILSSCMGFRSQVNDLWRITVGAYITPDVTIADVDIIPEVTLIASLTREERYNTVKGTFIDPNNYAQEIDFIPVTSSTYVTRDNGEVIEKTIQLPMTNSPYMAQRIAFKWLLQSDQMMSCEMPLRWTGLKLASSVAASVSYAKHNWSGRTMRCTGLKIGGNDKAPVVATLRMDASSAWSDPAVSDYSTVNAQGVVTLGDVLLPNPTAGSGDSGEVTVRNANFELGDWYWDGTGVNGWSIVTGLSPTHSGDWVAAAVYPGSSALTSIVNTLRYPCQPGTRVTFGGFISTNASFVAAGGGGGAFWTAAYYDSAGAPISNANANAVTGAGTGWIMNRGVDIAPAGTHFVSLIAGCAQTHAGGYAIFDDGFLLVETGGKLGENIVDSSGNIVGDSGALNAQQVVGVGTNDIITRDSSGAWPAGNPTYDRVTTFYRNGSPIATHTVRFSLTTSTGVMTVADLSSTGETTTYSEAGDPTSGSGGIITAYITHTASLRLSGSSFTMNNFVPAGGGGGGISK